MKTFPLFLLSLLPFGAALADAPTVRTAPKTVPPVVVSPPNVRAVPRVPDMVHVPPCYLVGGYGTDRQGKGHFLDMSGNALPMSGVPQTVEIRTLNVKALARLPRKPLAPAARLADK